VISEPEGFEDKLRMLGSQEIVPLKSSQSSRFKELLKVYLDKFSHSDIRNVSGDLVCECQMGLLSQLLLNSATSLNPPPIGHA
jgi:hypothetical protein